MKLWKASLLVGLMTVGFQMWSWIAGWLIAAAISVATAVAQRMNERKNQAEQEEYDDSSEGMHSRMSGSYRPSRFAQGSGRDPLARYAPQNRQPRSSSDLMNYLRSFTQPR